ncbi:transmembrane protein, putative (macronuclear) [Tetrahymena thermophila SB210]|uniref:Transmembrane protein, putative n=1 Tax=Tetrahymena thermophila (strain SB210) TaxID=312017 RepID=Q22ZF0_TETTS|nr:transmembrane protein, putative [Tetrahymena thermophila SB210]EAR90371.2 transmembrane protein, putative [Tetrahymena thermophila SB210]|eukprot:XP_001010616.2 transmembrane protein, putative [Tetrahymena thermophila SB210]
MTILILMFFLNRNLLQSHHVITQLQINSSQLLAYKILLLSIILILQFIMLLFLLNKLQKLKMKPLGNSQLVQQQEQQKQSHAGQIISIFLKLITILFHQATKICIVLVKKSRIYIFKDNSMLSTIQLQSLRLAIYYVDYSAIPSDKTKPFQPLGRQSFWISGPEFTKQTNINFRNTYLNSDYGLMGTDIQTTNTLTFSGDREQVSPKSGNLLYDCYISFEKNVDNIYNRSYQKLDRSLSQLGGIFNIFFTVGAIICRPLSQIELDSKLINRLFNFENPTQESNKKKQDKKRNFKDSEKKKEIYTQAADQILITKEDQQKTSFKYELQNTFYQKSQISFGQKGDGEQLNVYQNRPLQKLERVNSTKMKKTYQEKLKTLKKGENKDSNKKSKKEIEKEAKELNDIFSQNKVSFQGWEYFANYFKFLKLCKRRRCELLQKGLDGLYNQIDIFYIIQKLFEVEKLKRLLLNENQIKLFEFIPKPVLSLDEKKSNNLSDKIGLRDKYENYIKQKTSEVQEAFQKLINSKTKPSKIDIRILELLDPQFKQFLSDLGDIKRESTKLRQNTILESQQKSIFQKEDFILDNLQVPIEECSSQQKSQYFNFTPSKTLGSIYSSQKKVDLSNLYPI